MQPRVLIISFDNTLTTSSGSDTEARFISYGRKIVVLVPHTTKDSYRRVNDHLEIIGLGGPLPIKVVKTLVKGRDLIKTNNLNLIVTSDPTLGFLGWLLKHLTKTQLNINVFSLDLGYLNWFVKKIQLFALAHADSIRTDSIRAKTELAALGFNPQTIKVIPVLPSSNLVFQKTKIKPKSILAVGYLIKQKNFETLIKAASLVVVKHPDASFTIVGSGPEHQKLEALIASLNLANHVILHQAVPFSKLPSFYQTCDIFVMSSLYEGGPRVVMEAGLAQKAIVATDVGSVSDMLKNNYSGIIVPPGSVADLANGITYLLDHPDQANLFAARAKIALEKYCDHKKVNQELLAFWQETIDKTK